MHNIYTLRSIRFFVVVVFGVAESYSVVGTFYYNIALRVYMAALILWHLQSSSYYSIWVLGPREVYNNTKKYEVQ